MIKPSRKQTMKKIDPGKSLCQNWHSKKRAKERLGIILTDELTDQIIACIKDSNKKNDLFEIEFIEEQSNRLKHYFIKFANKEPIKIVYDCFRKTIVTFLYDQDESLIHHYYDFFNNKVSTKHTFGKVWNLKGKKLDIPGEDVYYNVNGDYWYVKEGILKDKYFQLINNQIVEIYPPKGTQ